MKKVFFLIVFTLVSIVAYCGNEPTRTGNNGSEAGIMMQAAGMTDFKPELKKEVQKTFYAAKKTNISKTEKAQLKTKTKTQKAKKPQQMEKGGLAVICFFFGCLGVHRFMMHRTGTAIIMLLTFGCFGVWTLIDFILILTGDLYYK